MYAFYHIDGEGDSDLNNEIELINELLRRLQTQSQQTGAIGSRLQNIFDEIDQQETLLQRKFDNAVNVISDAFPNLGENAAPLIIALEEPNRATDSANETIGIIYDIIDNLQLGIAPAMIPLIIRRIIEHIVHNTPAKNPLARDVLESIPVVKYTASEYSPSCNVCLNDFNEGTDDVRILKCKHTFHKDCIDEWLGKNNKTCPICRADAV